MSAAPELSLVLVGFGHVARRFVRLLREVGDRLDFEWPVVAIATRHHGSVIDTGGVDTARALTLVEGSQSLDRLDAEPAERSGLDVIRQVSHQLADDAAGRLVLVESTILDIDRGEPAIAHARAALEAQMHAVTVNKGPAAFAYDELESLAEAMDRVFFFEGAVMDGIPVFNLVRETLPAVRVEGFRGVVNTTANFVLSALERGQGLTRRCARCRRAASPRPTPRSTSTAGTPRPRRRRSSRADGRHDDAPSGGAHGHRRGSRRRHPRGRGARAARPPRRLGDPPRR